MEFFLPQNVEVEQNLIGACLLGGFCPPLKPGEFYQPSHRLIVRAMANMENRGLAIDSLTVAEHLSVSGHLEAVGGVGYLAQLMGVVGDARNLDAYANLVRKKFRARRLIELCASVLERSHEVDSQDVSALVSDLQGRLNEIEGTSLDSVRSVGEELHGVLSGIDARRAAGGGLLGIATGLNDVDRATSGLVAGDLIVLAGRPSMGKTALAVSFALAAARKNKRVLFISLEMTSEQLIHRMLAQESMLDLGHIRRGLLSDQKAVRLLDSSSAIEKLQVFIDDSGGTTELDIRSCVRKVRPDLLIVDYLQLVSCSVRAERKDLEIALITRTLKGIAKEFFIPVVLLSQLNRAIERRENRRPLLSDLRDSGAIEQDADLIAFVHREHVYAPTPENERIAEVIIGKQRNGPVGLVRVAFFPFAAAFRDLEVLNGREI